MHRFMPRGKSRVLESRGIAEVLRGRLAPAGAGLALLLGVVGWLGTGCADGAAAAPAAGTPPEALPGAAAWPVRRYDQPLTMLAFSSKGASLAGYQRLTRRLHATIDFRYTDIAGDSIYHVNDKWIEPKDNPTADELAAYVTKTATGALQLHDGQPPADVIFCDRLDYPGLIECVKAGAVLVTCGSTYPATESPLAAEWPAKPTARNSWMSGGATRTDGPALSGLPLQWLAGHTWIPIAEATDGSLALATGECGAVFTRRVGKGAIVFVPTGLISRHWAAIRNLGRRYDHDEIWLRLWDQLLYETVRGPAALPAYSDLRPGAKEAAPGQDYVLPARIVNRTVAGPLAVTIHVTTPHGKIVYVNEQTLEVPAGGEHAFDVRIPVAAEWGAGLYPVYLTVGDPAVKKQCHQSLEFIPVAGQVALALQPEKRGWRLGEEARFTLTASSPAPWTGTLDFGVYDFRGRLLGVARRAATLTPEAQPFVFTWRLADHGVRVDAMWAEVLARRDGIEWGRTEAKFYKYEPWSMRNEYQWSTWPGIACAPPSLVPPAMRLMEHAGMNALGYPGRNELSYAAERWGWRYYNEGIGMNTFSPVIEYENDAEIEAALAAEAARSLDADDLTSAAFVLASVGEEAGYKSGWGRTYYWDAPVAPDKACRAFQWYLKTRYADLARLNATWHTGYQAWEEIKLTAEFSGQAPKLEADGWAHPKDSPLGNGSTGVSLAPYTDTTQFYAWYYDRFIAAAKRIFRDRINPVPLTMASAPASWIFASRECDVRLAGPGGWNDSQTHALMDGPEPGFGLIWGHFDWEVKTDDMFWGFLLARSGHNNYWVDVPLMFNNDLTHTRASFAMREWTQRLAGHERIILDSRPAPSDVGLLAANGLGTDNTRAYMADSLRVALGQGGFGLPAAAPLADSANPKIVFAIGHQAVSPEEAARLNGYVEGGGTLVFTPRFACQDEFGAPLPVSPGQGLAEKWGFRVAERQDPIPQYYSATTEPLPLDGVAEGLKGAKMAAQTIFREKVSQQGWTSLAEFADGTPAILTRTLGKGRLVYVNAIYASHWYIQWVTPTGPERQGFYRLVASLCEQAGARRTLRLDGDLAQTLHMAVKEFTDPTGHIRYVIVRTGGEVPWTAGQLSWLGPQQAGYDVLNGGVLGREVPLNLRPGAGRFLAFTDQPVKRLRLDASPSRIVAGEPVKLEVHIDGADGKPVPGSFPMELRVLDGDAHEIEGLRRSFSIEDGKAATVATALSDPAGRWTLRVTDGISGLTAETRLRVGAPEPLAEAPGFVPWGWPSERQEAATLSDGQFLAGLTRLAALYHTDHSADNWLAKQRLGYYYDFFPDTRHAILRPLLDIDWTAHSAAMRRAVTDGAEFVFTGEDLGLHPGSGLSVYPHHDARQFEALLAALEGARWTLASPDGDTVAAALGKGRVILCRESIDAAGHDNPSVIRWQQRWLAELNLAGPAMAAPKPAALTRWWTGQEAIAPLPRSVTWFEGNRREVTLKLSPAQPLGEVFTLVIPPTSEVQDVALTIDAPAGSKAVFDVGCDGTPDSDLTAAVAQCAKTAAFRDGNGWRLVPVRVTAPKETEVRVSMGKVTVRP